MNIKKPLHNKHQSSSVKMALINLFILFLFYSCNFEHYKIVELEDVKITIPSDWHLSESNSIDSGVWFITSKKNDTIFVDYGKYSDLFDEVIQVRDVTRKKEYDSLGIKYPKNMVFSETALIDEAQGLYLNEYFYYDTICGRRAKVGFPKITGNGRCLLSIPKIDKYGNRLSMFVKNVDKTTQNQVFDIFKSITINSSN